MTMLGYQNKILRVDLTAKSTATEPLRMDWAEKYIGSKGLAIKYLYEIMKPGVDPLSPDNKLLLMTGPMTGTPVPCSGKLAIAAKSPATGTICDCSIGGHSALQIKYAGYDAIILEGALNAPGYLLIEDENVRFEDASRLWGKGSHDTEAALAEKYGHDYSILSIGPAGDNQVIMACINSDYYRQAGRGGMGAVMGSKKLKAIVIKGTRGVRIPDIVENTKKIIQILREETLHEDNSYIYDYGTTAFVEACSDGGILPRKNFSDATDENWTKYNGEVLLEKKIGKRGCGSCGLGCGNFLQFGDATVEGPEYESIAVAGPNSGVDDPEAIVKFNQIADDMGLDTISAGDTISFAMEMTEKGIHDFGIKFGDKVKYLKYLELMARREGVGADLALGVKKLSEKYGGKDFAMQVKGLEYPQYEPRASWGMSLSYAVSDRGACHMRAYAPNDEVFAASIPPYTPEGKGAMVVRMSISSAVKFSLCICDFWGGVSFTRMAELMTIVTGKEWTEQEMKDVGLRVVNIARAFNQREGFDRKHDTIPKRLVNEALQSGPGAGQKIPQEAFEDMLDQYYAVLGWDKNGRIPDNILSEL